MSSFLDRVKARHAAFISDAVSRGYSEAAARLALDITYRRRIHRTHKRLAAECEDRKEIEEADRHRREMVKAFRAICTVAREAKEGVNAVALLREMEAGR
jgi:hypothetical protein